MKEAVLEMVKGLLGSKKFVAMLVGALVAVGVRVGMDPEVAAKVSEQVMILVLGYMGSQAAADLGKEKAKIEADAK